MHKAYADHDLNSPKGEACVILIMHKAYADHNLNSPKAKFKKLLNKMRTIRRYDGTKRFKFAGSEGGTEGENKLLQ
jgi:hypothetical protein